MRFLFFLITVIAITSCDSSNVTDTNKNREEELIQQQKEFARLDSILAKTMRFRNLTGEIWVYGKFWVLQQTRTDSRDKQLLNQKLAIYKTATSEIKELCNETELQKIETVIIPQQNIFLEKINIIKEILPDFASYDQSDKIFAARLLIEDGGELDLTVRKLIMLIEEFITRTKIESIKAKEKIQKIKLKLRTHQ